jgi:hypothetical protein
MRTAAHVVCDAAVFIFEIKAVGIVNSINLPGFNKKE